MLEVKPDVLVAKAVFFQDLCKSIAYIGIEEFVSAHGKLKKEKTDKILNSAVNMLLRDE